jgi:hypothetical protein
MEVLPLQQRLLRPPIGIGIAGEQMVRVIAMQHQEVKPHARSGLAVHRIEDVGRQPSGTRHWVTFLRRSPDYQK